MEISDNLKLELQNQTMSMLREYFSLLDGDYSKTIHDIESAAQSLKLFDWDIHLVAEACNKFERNLRPEPIAP